MSNTFAMKYTRELKVQLGDAKVLVMGKRLTPKVHAVFTITNRKTQICVSNV